VRVRVRLFARYREATGQERLDVELPEGGTVETAWAAVVGRHPVLTPFRPFTLFAVGHDYVQPDHALRADDELCLFPPVSGGSAGDVFRVVEHPLSSDAIAAEVDDPGAGGIVIFSGVVRNETGGRPVKFLEYEAHAPMAEAKMRAIGDEIRARWSGVRRIAMLHRFGRLEIGESSVLIAVSAAHRGEAFEACRYAIDTLKASVPIWKKEFYADGATWLEGPGSCETH
jgi:molybdopterin synthase catalytic subunit/molybdopterin converting factor small subunit